MDISSTVPDDRSFPPMGSTTATAANSSFLVTPIRPSLASTTSISVSASASDADISPILLLLLFWEPVFPARRRQSRSYPFLPVGTQWNGHCAKFLGCQWIARPNCCTCDSSSCQRPTNLSIATIVDQHARRPSSSTICNCINRYITLVLQCPSLPFAVHPAMLPQPPTTL